MASVVCIDDVVVSKRVTDADCNRLLP